MTFSPITHFDRQDYVEHENLEEALNFQKNKYDLWQPKYDGIWGRVEVRGHDLELYSRTGERKHQAVLPQRELFSTECTLLCEFMFGSQWAQAEGRYGKMFVFDLVMLDGADLKGVAYHERYRLLKSYLHGRSFFNLVPCFRMQELGPWWMKNEKTKDFEGAVFRRWHDPYDKKLGKLKLNIEDDFVITGFVEGKGKHAGRLGALELGQYRGTDLVPVMTCGGGFSDSLREHVWTNRIHFIGKVCTISGKARFDSGALRHPNFVNFRADKPALSCQLLTTPSSLETKKPKTSTPSLSI